MKPQTITKLITLIITSTILLTACSQNTNNKPQEITLKEITNNKPLRTEFKEFPKWTTELGFIAPENLTLNTTRSFIETKNNGQEHILAFYTSDFNSVKTYAEQLTEKLNLNISIDESLDNGEINLYNADAITNNGLDISIQVQNIDETMGEIEISISKLNK